MKDIILKHKEILYRKNNPISNEYKGAYGACSAYKNGLIKIFYTTMEDQHIINLENNLKRNSKIIMYPKCRVIEKETNNICGYYMEKAPGISLLKLRNKIICGDADLSFDRFLYLYYDKFLPELKKEEVLLFDMKDNQIFIDNNIYLVDTDPFLSIYDKSAQSWLKSNDYKTAFEYNTYHINRVFSYMFSFINNRKIYINEELKNESYIKKYVDEMKSNGKIKTFKEYSKNREW